MKHCMIQVQTPGTPCDSEAVDAIQLFDRLMRMRVWVPVCERHLAAYRNRSMKMRTDERAERNQTGA